MPDEREISFSEVQRLSLQPGEVLVLHVDGLLDAERMKRIRDLLDGVWPHNKCIVLQRGMRFEVLSQEAASCA